MTTTDEFDYSVLEQVSHRPWPLPEAPWMMRQSWHHLLFSHWRVSKQQLAAVMPSGLELDLHHGEAWLGIIPFHMTNVAPRLVPAVPWVSSFPELNVRTYVRVSNKPGIFVFSMDSGNPLVAFMAKTFFNLPYHSASMDVNVVDRGVRYSSQRAGVADGEAKFVAAYQPDGGVFEARHDSLEYFLMERYCLYTVDRGGRPERLDIHHRPWRLQQARATFQWNTMAEANGIALPAVAPLLHYAERQDALAWLPKPAI